MSAASEREIAAMLLGLAELPAAAGGAAARAKRARGDDAADALGRKRPAPAIMAQ